MGLINMSEPVDPYLDRNPTPRKADVRCRKDRQNIERIEPKVCTPLQTGHIVDHLSATPPHTSLPLFDQRNNKAAVVVLTHMEVVTELQLQQSDLRTNPICCRSSKHIDLAGCTLERHSTPSVLQRGHAFRYVSRIRER